MTTVAVDFEHLAAFNFQWECAFCGVNDVTFGLAQAYADAKAHRAVCHG